MEEGKRKRSLPRARPWPPASGAAVVASSWGVVEEPGVDQAAHLGGRQEGQEEHHQEDGLGARR